MTGVDTQLGGRLVVCVGAGGVGKTTVAAAIALARAAAGERVAVVTIDPAPRLARALGFETLDDEPRRVAGADGELWAMRLDPKRTLDELIASLAPDAPTRDRALSNRVYRELSSAIAGSQEFSAVAKLYELDRSGSFDAIVLDTPPSRNALDFLDAPGRLVRFFEGRALRMLVTQGGLATRAARRATSPVLGALDRLLGAGVLREIGAFLTSIGSMVDGLGERAAAVAALLRDPQTGFVLVTAPRREAVEETIAFAAELRRGGLPLAALVVNRVHSAPVDGAALGGLEALLGARLSGLVRASLDELRARAAADAAAVTRLRAAFVGLEPLSVPELDAEPTDLPGLRLMAAHLGYGRSLSSDASPSVAQ